MVGLSEQNDLTLDSTFFVAFELTHRALKSGLKNASCLNMTQYRILVKLFVTQPAGLVQVKATELLRLKANVVTQALNVLEDIGFAKRTRASTGDARLRSARITKEGIAHIACVNNSIVQQLYALFPTENSAYRNILEAAIAAGANIDSQPPNEPTSLGTASRALVSLELVKKSIEAALYATCKASYNECRVLQRLGEQPEPLRIKDIAHQLQMTPVAVARAVEALAKRTWVVRLASPHDHKAVFVSPTKRGVHQQRVIARTITLLARKYLWGHLTHSQQLALAQAWRVVIAEVQAREETERRETLSLLQPIAATRT